MTRADELLEALWNSAVAGDFESGVFLQMFAPWAALNADTDHASEIAGVKEARGAPHPKSSKSLRRKRPLTSRRGSEEIVDVFQRGTLANSMS
jgi:hypothetical protein